MTDDQLHHASGHDPERQHQRLIPTVAHFAQTQYLPHIRVQKISFVTDEAMLRKYILPEFGTRSLDEVTPELVADFFVRLRSRGYANSSCNRLRAVLRYMFNLARKWKVPGASDNPTSGTAALPELSRERYLTSEEVQRLLLAADVDRPDTAAVIKLLILTGARRSEITKAKWEYIDWNKCTLLVPRAKSGRPRAIALNTVAIGVLRALGPNDSGHIFPQLVGNGDIRRSWVRIRRRAGMPDVRLHDLRHSFASFLINSGASLYVVQNLLGHSNPRMTQRYAHLAPSTLLDAAEAVGKALVDQCK